MEPLAIRPDLSTSWRRQDTLSLCPISVISFSKGVAGTLEEGRLMTENDQSDFNTRYLSYQIPDYYSLVIATASNTAIIQQDQRIDGVCVTFDLPNASADCVPHSQSMVM